MIFIDFERFLSDSLHSFFLLSRIPLGRYKNQTKRKWWGEENLLLTFPKRIKEKLFCQTQFSLSQMVDFSDILHLPLLSASDWFYPGKGSVWRFVLVHFEAIFEFQCEQQYFYDDAYYKINSFIFIV